MSIIKRISYHHEGGRSSSITFSTNGRIESIITRHTVFDNIARFETAERIKTEIEKRATIDGGNVTVETFFGEVYDNARTADDKQYQSQFICRKCGFYLTGCNCENIADGCTCTNLCQCEI